MAPARQQGSPLRVTIRPSRPPGGVTQFYGTRLRKRSGVEFLLSDRVNTHRMPADTTSSHRGRSVVIIDEKSGSRGEHSVRTIQTLRSAPPRDWGVTDFSEGRVFTSVTWGWLADCFAVPGDRRESSSTWRDIPLHQLSLHTR